MYFVSVESLDSFHSTSRGVNCVYFVSVESLVTVLHVVLTVCVFCFC